jgi:hypothetical protein
MTLAVPTLKKLLEAQMGLRLASLLFPLTAPEKNQSKSAGTSATTVILASSMIPQLAAIILYHTPIIIQVSITCV